MLKFRLYYDKDEETEWLNQMAADGWAMKSFFAGFCFAYNYTHDTGTCDYIDGGRTVPDMYPQEKSQDISG